MLGNALRAGPPQKMKVLLFGCYPTHMYSRGTNCGTDEEKNLSRNSKRLTGHTNDIWDPMGFQYHLGKLIHIVIQCLPVIHQSEHISSADIFKRIYT
jgi:hypothetical protein